MGHWSPRTCISPLRSFSLMLLKNSKINNSHPTMDIHRTYLGKAQSMPAGQSNAPVLSWWKPRVVLILRLSGGLVVCPGKVIQSTMAVFIVFVSSARAPFTPFSIYVDITHRLGWRYCQTTKKKNSQDQRSTPPLPRNWPKFVPRGQDTASATP